MPLAIDDVFWVAIATIAATLLVAKGRDAFVRWRGARHHRMQDRRPSIFDRFWRD